MTFYTLVTNISLSLFSQDNIGYLGMWNPMCRLSLRVRQSGTHRVWVVWGCRLCSQKAVKPPKIPTQQSSPTLRPQFEKQRRKQEREKTILSKVTDLEITLSSQSHSILTHHTHLLRTLYTLFISWTTFTSY